MLGFLLPNFKDASTWRGIIMVLGAFGLTVAPELKEAIVATAVALAGLVEIIRDGIAKKA